MQRVKKTLKMFWRTVKLPRPELHCALTLALTLGLAVFGSAGRVVGQVLGEVPSSADAKTPATSAPASQSVTIVPSPPIEDSKLSEPPDPALMLKLQEVEKLAAAIKDLSADFEQEKFTPLLRRPARSGGTVVGLSDTLLWKTTEPTETRLQVTPKSLKLYYVADAIVEVYPIEGKLGALAANPVPRLAVLLKSFDIKSDEEALPHQSANCIAIELVPTDPELVKHVAKVRVRIDPRLGVTQMLEVTDADGERTVLRFSNYKLNQNLKASAVELDVAAGVKVVHPLDGTGRDAAPTADPGAAP